MVTVFSLTSALLGSKTYVIDANPDSAIIIDPGDPDISELIQYLTSYNKKQIKVLLTHEHADHCAGVNPLYLFKPFELICIRIVAESISDNKRNLSKYLPNSEPFEINIPITIIADNEWVRVFDCGFMCIETPGHSPGSTCFLLKDSMFSGDTLLNNTKTPLNLPGSDKKLYLQSIQKLGKYIHKGMTIYPGHGELFTWNYDMDPSL